MFTPPQAQHQWLRRLVGQWTLETECVMAPDQPPAKTKGRERVRMMGDLWVVCEGSGEMPGGGEMTYLMVLGYDPVKQKFVGSWAGSPMAHLFTYEGDLDEKGPRGDGSVHTLPLVSVGPSMTDSTKTATYKDVTELHADGRRIMYSEGQGDDGSWHRFMTATYTRVS